MFGNNSNKNKASKNKNPPKAKAGAADTLICKQTKIKGDISFTGVLYIDGYVQGDISSGDAEDSLLTIGTHGYVEGQINVPHIMILGRVKGDVHALEHVELMTNSRIEGDVYYRLIEMAMGAEVNGQMVHSVEKQKLLSHHGKEISDDKADSKAGTSSPKAVEGSNHMTDSAIQGA